MTSTGTGSDAGISDAASVGSEYEVFLSFRGPDVRDKFADHLYTRLRGAGVKVYRDDEEIPFGGGIGPELLKGIKRSRIAIPIFTKGYAMSKWCLNELVQIMECKRHGRLTVMPLFYDVTPSEVGNQTGSYEEAFNVHGNRPGEKTIIDWKRALSEVGKLKGWDLQFGDNKEEGKLVEKIIKQVLHELKKVHLSINENLVGLEDHVDEILSKINAERSRMEVLGIHGIGGVGKTTLAKFIYNKLLPQFESCSFVPDIRETFKTKGIQSLQKKLISDILCKESAENIGSDEGFHTISERFPDRKVLILLDDVDNIVQIKGLMGERDWFASGSIIIITTRYREILKLVHADWPYELPCLPYQHALRLFIKHAFGNVEPPQDYRELSEKAVTISGGLPLSLQVIGSLLHHKSKEDWECILKKYEKVPPIDVKETLGIGFHALDERQQRILLDIACFFIGVDHRMAIHYWDGMDLYPNEAIIVLQEKSLIKIEADNLIWMHDQMRDFCRDYSANGHVGEPEEWRILWNREQAAIIFMKKMVAESVQGLFLEFNMQSQSLFTAENFAKLPNLKFLQAKGDISQVICLFGRGLRKIARLFSLVRRSSLILSQLRWLCWRHLSSVYELNIFSSRNLVFLDLSESDIRDGWDHWSDVKVAEKLKVLNLSGCKKLTKTPNFSKHLLLEQLILERCSSLVRIDSSISMLKHLLIINLRGCSSLHELPKELGNMESLVELILDDTSISKLPESIKGLKHLLLLSLRNCSSILALPESIGGLVSLIRLDLSCSGIIELPDSIANMKNLKILNVDGCNIRKLPTSVGMLERLEVISADGCHCLESIPNLPHCLISLTARSEKRMMAIPDFSNLTSLKHLVAIFVNVPFDPPNMEIIWNIGKLSKLVNLKVSLPHIQTLHRDLGELSYLKEMVLEKCHSLRSIPKLPSNLMMLQLNDCGVLKSLPDLSHLKNLRDLHIGQSPIDIVEGLQMLENLRKLVFDRCGIQILPDMSNLKKLKVLEVKSCQYLVGIQGRSLESLEELHIFDCMTLVTMPNIPNKETMKRFSIENCGNLGRRAYPTEKFREDDKKYEKRDDTKDKKDDKKEDPKEAYDKKGGGRNPCFPFPVCCPVSLSANYPIVPPAYYGIYATETSMMDDADENISAGNHIIIALLLVLGLLAPIFLGFEPYRLSWLGIFLHLILLFILGGFHFMIF